MLTRPLGSVPPGAAQWRGLQELKCIPGLAHRGLPGARTALLTTTPPSHCSCSMARVGRRSSARAAATTSRHWRSSGCRDLLSS